MPKGSPSLKLVHSVDEPEITTAETYRKRAHMGVVRRELGLIFGNSEVSALAELSRITALAREIIKQALHDYFDDAEVANSVEPKPDMEYSALENGKLKICFGFVYEGKRRLIGAEVDSKYRLGSFLKGECSDEAAFTIFDPEEE